MKINYTAGDKHWSLPLHNATDIKIFNFLCLAGLIQLSYLSLRLPASNGRQFTGDTLTVRLCKVKLAIGTIGTDSKDSTQHYDS